MTELPVIQRTSVTTRGTEMDGVVPSQVVISTGKAGKAISKSVYYSRTGSGHIKYIRHCISVI